MSSLFEKMTPAEAQANDFWDAIEIKPTTIDKGLGKERTPAINITGSIMFELDVPKEVISGHEMTTHMHGPVFDRFKTDVDEIAMVVAHKIKWFYQQQKE